MKSIKKLPYLGLALPVALWSCKPSPSTEVEELQETAPPSGSITLRPSAGSGDSLNEGSATPSSRPERRRRERPPMASEWAPGHSSLVINPHDGRPFDIRGALEGVVVIDDEGREFRLPPKPDEPFITQSEETKRPKYPQARPVPGRPGFVFNPYTDNQVDVRGILPGSLVMDPADPNKYKFQVPEQATEK